MALPSLLQRLFEKAGFGEFLKKEIIPNHADIHKTGERDSLELDASQITSGVLSLKRLPPTVQERSFEVKNTSDLFSLTTEDVQNGDLVLVTKTGVWYQVHDDEHLDKMNSYKVLSTSHINTTNGNASLSDATVKFQIPVNISIKGLNTDPVSWDGSSNLVLIAKKLDSYLIESIRSIVTVEYIEIPTYNITNRHKGHMLCCKETCTLQLLPADKTNGWNCYIKNTTEKSCYLLTDFAKFTIDGLTDKYEIFPLMSVHIIFDGKSNYITISNMPLVTSEDN